MKLTVAVLVFYNTMQVALSAFDLFGSMDDTRSAILSFYSPVHVQSKSKSTTSGVKPPVKKAKPELHRIRPMVHEIKPKGHKMVAKFRRYSTKKSKGSKGRRASRRSRRYGLGISKHASKDMRYLTHKVVVTEDATLDRPSTIDLGGMAIPDPLNVKLVSVAPLPKVTAIRKPAPQKRASLNKFAEAIEDIEKALADAQLGGSRVKHNQQRLSKLRDLIKTAVQKRSYRFARKAIGEAMFTIKKMNEGKKSGRGKRGIALSSKNFLGSVRQSLGVSGFNDLLAMQGQVTLMFAIDDTGSMNDEIATAKKIAKSIVDQPRAEPVDYVLSPFNDPGTGPVTYCDETEKDKFVKAIESLKPHAGGDCPELTFKGMSDAIDEGIQPDSPLYVFTDADAKASEDDIQYLESIAQDQGVVVNIFFVKSSGCAKSSDVSSFKRVAEATFGQVFELKNVFELQQMTGLTATSLGGTAVLSKAASTSSVRKKRGVSKTTKSYSIPVDDSIETVVISVTTDQPVVGDNWSVSLSAPSGTTAGATNVNNLAQGTVYQISKPNVGIWNLGIKTDSNVNYDFFVKGSSTDNIDFEYYFVKTTVQRRRGAQTIPIASPILGKQAEAILTLGGVAHVDPKTLRAELVTLEGDVIQTSKPTSLTPKDKNGVRYSFKFYPPNQVFNIKLKGRTKKGNSFERICHKAIKPETLLVKVLFARNDYTMTRGGSGYVIFTVENFGDTEVVEFKSFGSLGTVEKQSRQHHTIRKGRRTSFSVSFRGGAKATKGVTVTIVVTVKGKTSGSKSILSVPLLVV